MLKFLISAALISLTGLVSCIDPYDPYKSRPRYPDQPYPPQRLDPYGQDPRPDPYGSTDPDFNRRPDQPRPLPPTPPAAGGYPTATRTANPNQVLSPYEPFNVIDVEGFQPGQLARDPSNQKIFRIP
jgi:hypothetical protein